ncbi:hypothetical protein ATK17_0138 [Branchiibius hedensis]|uniref:Uncharacterized protein n=1 Tax=Branchiibius hedensis TaxID=672460 RepID=A0A2Y9C0M2_9MICO|nr:hypothetical protein ATK17_0138 [Branchiibius hedensis]SSA32873.1 hypothetical protein SAMN04489750_0138 [Branchiibius hedensis]
MSTYEPDDTKGNIGKIVGSIFGVPPILLDEAIPSTREYC